jgi:hypothetical protein
MKMSDAFPSSYLRATDFTKPTLATMSHVKMEDIGDDHKPVLYFQELEKGLVLNKTNGNAIADIYGDDTGDWTGQHIVLFETMVDYMGKMVPAVRVRKPRVPQKTAPAPEPTPEPKPNPVRHGSISDAYMDPDVPF